MLVYDSSIIRRTKRPAQAKSPALRPLANSLPFHAASRCVPVLRKLLIELRITKYADINPIYHVSGGRSLGLRPRRQDCIVCAAGWFIDLYEGRDGALEISGNDAYVVRREWQILF